MAQPDAQNAQHPAALSEGEINDLSSGTAAERAAKNLALWRKYQTSDLRRAYVHLERAWNLGIRDKDTCRNLVHLMQQEDRMHDIQRVLQQAAYNAAARNDKSLYIDFISMYQRYTVGYGLQVQDPVLNDITGKLFAPARPELPPYRKDAQPHLVYHVPLPQDPRSTLPPIPFEFAKLQKDSEFKISIVFSLSAQDVQKQNPRLIPLIEDVKAQGVSVHFVDLSTEKDSFGQLQKLCSYLTDMDIDVLFCMLQIYQDYFVAAMRPARHVIGMEFGHPEWYTSPFIDKVISSQRHLAMESHTENLPVYVGSPRKYTPAGTKLTPADIGVPEGKKIILSSGAKDRLQNPDFWKLIHAVIQSTNHDWVIMGIDNNEKENILQGVDTDIRTRIHCLGYRNDFPDVLSLADTYVDTFPIGGGWGLIEAMARNIPCVTFKHDYNRIFNKHQNYFPLGDYADDPDFAVDIDGHKILARINDFINDEASRQAQIKRQNVVLEIVGTPTRGVKELDEALLEIARS